MFDILQYYCFSLKFPALNLKRKLILVNGLNPGVSVARIV